MIDWCVVDRDGVSLVGLVKDEWEDSDWMVEMKKVLETCLMDMDGSRKKDSGRRRAGQKL